MEETRTFRFIVYALLCFISSNVVDNTYVSIAFMLVSIAMIIALVYNHVSNLIYQ